MKDNTYVIPAIKFYILKGPEDLDDTLSDEIVDYEFDRMMKKGEPTIIPFSNVDGLTVFEMATSLRIDKHFAIAAANVCEEKSVTDSGIKIDKVFSFFDLVRFSLTDDKMDVPVDKMFETYIEGVYSSASDKQKRIYHSFLEEYRYQNYEMTKAKIKEINQNRK